MAVLRLGRKLGSTDGLQTLYIQRGAEPSGDDPCVGMVITPDLAKIIVQAVNEDETFARLVELG
jgi:hypothetical protein